MDNLAKQLTEYNWEQYGLQRDMSLDDYKSLIILMDMIKHQDMKILEIGTRQGSSAALFASYIKQYGGKFYTCDNYEVNSIGIKNPTPYIKLIFEKHIQNLELTNYIDFIHKSSLETSKMFDDNTFDLVFIDGCHVYSYVKEDIELWYPKVKINSILCGHDAEFIPKDDFIVETLKHNSGLGELSWKTSDMVLFHCGVIVAVYEKFKQNAKLVGNRIWWVKKNG